MDAVLRAVAVYVVLLLIFRITGKRSLAQVTTFDFVLLLVVGEATQQTLLGDDFSITNAALVIATLFTLERLADTFSFRFPRLRRTLESVPLILVEDGDVLHDRMRTAHISTEDVLAAARQSQGIERLDQIKFAVLEKSGGISVIPR